MGQFTQNPLTGNYDYSNSSGGGSGTVTSFAFTDANGITGSVGNPTVTPTLTLTLTDITPTTVNGVTISSLPTFATLLALISFRA